LTTPILPKNSAFIEKLEDSNKRSLRSQVKALMADYKRQLPECARKLEETIEAYKPLQGLRERVEEIT